jgi:hypothetical protein
MRSKRRGVRDAFGGTVDMNMKLIGSRLFSVGLLLALLAPVAPLPVPGPYALLSADEGIGLLDSFIVDVVELDDGSTVVGIEFPSPPPDPDNLPATPVVERTSAAAVVLSGVPAFDWCYGCSATSAAMMFGYYDRNGFPNMYAGPANGGVCPLTNATWGSGKSPLSATKMGLDGLDTRGHVDDFYLTYESALDPYHGNWTQHEYADCTADYMGTSQYQNWRNIDGSTRFYYYPSNAPLHDYTSSEGGSSPRRDGTHGMRLFAESRGYTVVQNYNQYIYGYNGVSAGFTFEQYCQEIDAGRPVVIQVAGHSMLGVGYDTPDTVYLHDTWDHSMHQMTWGGSYSGRTHLGVGVLVLEQSSSAPQAQTDAADLVSGTTATLRGTVVDDGGETCEYRFQYGTSPGSYSVSTAWTGSVSTGQPFSSSVTGLTKGQGYYFVAELRNDIGSNAGAELQFGTLPDPPSSLVAATTGPIGVDLSWTPGEGAGSTRLQRKTGDYPVDRTDGTTAYEGSGGSFSDTGLDPDTTYYYRAWSEADSGGQWSSTYDEALATTDGVLPVVSTQEATAITSESALLHGTVDDDRGETCEYRFVYDTESGPPYTFDTGWAGSVSTGNPFEATVSGLAPGTAYFFRTAARNSGGEATGDERTFTTLPSAPTDLVTDVTGDDSIGLSWISGEGSSDTLLVRKQGSYPSSRTDGVQVYFDSGTLYADTGLTPGATYYYRAWAYHTDSDQWSDGYAEATATTSSSGTPDIAVSPTTFDVILPPDVIRTYDLTISNDGEGPLSFTIGESIPPTSPPGPGAAPASSDDATDVSIETAVASLRLADDATELIVKFKGGLRGATSHLHSALGVAPASESSRGRFELVRVPAGRSAVDLARGYLESGLVEYVEPNYPRTLAWSPDDPLYNSQWHFDQVNAGEAWDIRQGATPDVVVAVLDTGVAYETYGSYVLAPDLAGTAFVPGWDFVNDDGHPNDDNGHGTHVTGTIAQTTGNGLGVAGLAFGVSIMPVKVLNASGSGTVAMVADGIYYAVDNGAHIINMSLAGSDTTQTEADALDYALSKGVTVICAAGNDYASGNEPQYPAAYDSTIAVGAVRYDATRAGYSNTGDYIDLVAPGGDLGVDQNTDGNPDGVRQQTFSGGYGNFSYAFYQGTSMACPHVSAAAALLLAENRSLDPDTVLSVLTSTAADLGDPGWDAEYGHGLLDVAVALGEVAGVPWLDESPKEGSVAPAGSTIVQLTVDTAGMADGDYYGMVVISSNDPIHPVTNVSFVLHVRTTDVPSVRTDASTGVEESGATLHGTLLNYGWELCEYAFEYGTQSGGPYEQTEWTGQLGTGEEFGEQLSLLDEGTTFYYRAVARNSAGTGYGDELTFTTKPVEPSNLSASPDTYLPFYRINLSWDKGEGAALTVVRAKEGDYPSDPADGVLVCEGDGQACAHSDLEPATAYFYRAWSYVEDAEGGAVWSDAFTDASASTAAEPSAGEFSLTLKPGWNMVSVPLLLSDMTIGSVFPGVQAVYEWNASTKSYGSPEELDPSLGYWVAVTAEMTLDYEGVPVEGWSHVLTPGWHLLGSVHGGDVDFSSPSTNPAGSALGFVYSWNTGSKAYDYSTQLAPGQGHWIAVIQDCSLTVELAA